MNNIDINSFKNIQEVEEYRKQINEACDARVEFIQQCHKASDLQSKSFLFIKEAFENMSPALFESADGKKIISKYTNTIKESNNLKSIHTLCENVRKASSAVDTDYFVNNITNVTWNVNKKSLKEDIKKLGRVLAEAYLYLGNDAEDYIPNEREALSTSLEYIAENKKSNNNITEYSEAVKVIKEAIEKQEMSEVIERKPISSLAESLIGDFNKKYEGSLTESERNLVKLLSTGNKHDVFNSLKENCLNKISEAITSESDSDTKERLMSINEQVKGKSYNEKSFSDDICGLYEMINVFES